MFFLNEATCLATVVVPITYENPGGVTLRTDNLELRCELPYGHGEAHLAATPIGIHYYWDDTESLRGQW